MEHPNLLKSDRDTLDCYCRMFELDWKDQKEAITKNNFMSTNPIYLDGNNIKNYGEVDNQRVKEMLKKACVPFVPQVTAQILKV